MSRDTIIPIQSVSAGSPTRCAHCLDSSVGPVCRSDLTRLCHNPQLEGPPALLTRLLDALDEALDVQVPGGLRSAGLIHALRCVEGEAELSLAVTARCNGAQLAQAAFQCLRRHLPDTDIYVRHVS